MFMVFLILGIAFGMALIISGNSKFAKTFGYTLVRNYSFCYCIYFFISYSHYY